MADRIQIAKDETVDLDLISNMRRVSLIIGAQTTITVYFDAAGDHSVSGDAGLVLWEAYNEGANKDYFLQHGGKL